MKHFFSLVLVFISIFSFAQREHHAEIVYGAGKYHSFSGNVVKNFVLLKSDKLHMGPGVRALVNFSGKNIPYVTAPHKLTKSDANMDTIRVGKPLLISANITLNASYHFTPKFAVGINLDVFGITIGRKKTGTFYPGSASQNEVIPRKQTPGVEVKPTLNNIFLAGDRSKGTLASEVFLRYTSKERYNLKVGYSYILTEYASKNRVGFDNNYRFRNKAGLFIIGFGYNFI